MNGNFHASVALLPVSVVNRQSEIGRYGEQTNPSLYGESNPGDPVCSKSCNDSDLKTT
jgi:hypothetical protein